jgi:hypothetical protein
MRFLGGLSQEFVAEYLMGHIKPCPEISFREQLGSNDEIDDEELLFVAYADGRTHIDTQGQSPSLDDGHIQGGHGGGIFHSCQEVEPSGEIGWIIPFRLVHHMIDVGEMASEYLWSANRLLITERSERLPFGYKTVPDPLFFSLPGMKMRIDKSS